MRLIDRNEVDAERQLLAGSGGGAPDDDRG
jgi:hypothetical protein